MYVPLEEGEEGEERRGLGYVPLEEEEEGEEEEVGVG